MRIIAGEFRGRVLLAPQGDATRPITDRVKQSVFDILAPRIAGSIVYDVFAGTGSMGLESLSRGATRSLFFERDRSAVARLRRNIETLGVAKRSQVVPSDLFKWFDVQDARDAALKAQLIFLDPPYRMLRENSEAMRSLADRIGARHLAGDGLIVFRHDANDTLELPSLRRADLREYGGMAVEFLTPTAPATD